MHDARQTPVSSAAVQLRQLHQLLSRGALARLEYDPQALSIYVHALSTEDVIVQVLLRGKPPLMLRYAPLEESPTAWQDKPDVLRRYARATRMATYGCLSRLRGQAVQGRRRPLRPGVTPEPVEDVVERLLIPCLARAAEDIASISNNRSLGRAALHSRDGRGAGQSTARSKMDEPASPRSIAAHCPPDPR